MARVCLADIPYYLYHFIPFFCYTFCGWKRNNPLWLPADIINLLRRSNRALVFSHQQHGCQLPALATLRIFYNYIEIWLWTTFVSINRLLATILYLWTPTNAAVQRMSECLDSFMFEEKMRVKFHPFSYSISPYLPYPIPYILCAIATPLRCYKIWSETIARHTMVREMQWHRESSRARFCCNNMTNACTYMTENKQMDDNCAKLWKADEKTLCINFSHGWWKHNILME